MAINPGLVAAYRTTRNRLAVKGFPNPATRCLELARADLERAGHDRFSYYPQSGLASYSNAPNDRGGRWIERPDLAGLRFVGFADKLSGAVNHTGWYAGEDSDGAVYRGAVYQLPARDGRAVYVEGWISGEGRRDNFRDSANGEDVAGRMSAVIYLNCRHIGERGGAEDGAELAAISAARGADREAEIMAEREREYQTAWRAGSDAAEAIADAGVERKQARELLAELRAVRGLADAPNICAALRRMIGEHLERARELYAEAANAWRENVPAPSYSPHLAGAFEDGAGAASYWESRK